MNKVERIKNSNYKGNFLLEILRILNHSSNTENAIHKLLSLFQEELEYDAIGIRIKSGVDYPYYSSNGFSDDFIKSEMNLCKHNADGSVVLDSSNNPILDCMCGNVICGRTNPEFDFFTDGGSFWSNNTTKLLAETSDEERQSTTRNRCNGEGYESVALIPLRSEKESIGLIQFNDKQKNVFKFEDIQFYEQMGESVGIALQMIMKDDQIREINNQLENRVKQRTLKLQETIEKKDLLLKEVHHRVKNNLQIISSLLEMQRFNSNSKNVREYLNNAFLRVQTMGELYNQLLVNDNYSDVKLKLYLTKLIDQISAVFKKADQSIIITKNISNNRINIDTAIPMGLIINEILSNSFKYAFKNTENPKIDLNVSVKKDQIFLNINDNGSGLPKKTKKSKGLGFPLIQSLVNQLNGSLKKTSNNGLNYEIVLQEELKDINRWTKNVQ